MEYLMLWSGDVKGMRKARVPAVPAAICGHLSQSGDIVTPCRDSIRGALPYRFRKAFDREKTIWFDKRSNDLPAHVSISDRRGHYLTTLYFQPLRESGE